jgi:hypothetical protein
MPISEKIESELTVFRNVRVALNDFAARCGGGVVLVRGRRGIIRAYAYFPTLEFNLARCGIEEIADKHGFPVVVRNAHNLTRPSLLGVLRIGVVFGRSAFKIRKKRTTPRDPNLGETV